MEHNWSGSLDNENSSASVDIVFSNSNRATDGDVYDTTMRIDRSFNYNASTIRINASGIKVLDINTGKDVQEFSSIGTVSVNGSSKTLEVNGSVSFDINYHMGLNVGIAFNCSLNSSSWEIYAGAITAYWSGVSNNCGYSFKSDNSLSYTGSSPKVYITSGIVPETQTIADSDLAILHKLGFSFDGEASGWVEGLPYIKTESGWKEATAYIKTEDGWKYLSAFQKKA